MKRLIALSTISLLTVVTIPTATSAAVWDDDGGLVFIGGGYSTPTPYAPAQNALAGRTLDRQVGSGEVTCGIDSSGAAICWGDPELLGDGANGWYTGPALVDTSGPLNGKTLIDIDSGGTHSCAVSTTGRAYCWGFTGHRKLGQPLEARVAYSPVGAQRGDIPQGASLTQITAGAAHSCALDDGGRAYCWGKGSLLGTDRARDTPRPQRVTGSLLRDRTLVAIDAGSHHTCALDSAGRAYCWGVGTDAQLGDGSRLSSSKPVRVRGTGPQGLELRTISAGDNHTCAVSFARRVACWGGNRDHQASDRDRDVIRTADVVGAMTARNVSAGHEYTCAVDVARTAHCWGSNLKKTLGVGGYRDRAVPTPVDTNGVMDGVQIRSVSTGIWNACALDTDGISYCWGFDADWMYEDTPSSTERALLVDQAPSLMQGEEVNTLTSSGVDLCIITESQRLICADNYEWTPEEIPDLGDFNEIPTDAIPNGEGMVSVSGQFGTHCLLTDVGAAYCWGQSGLGSDVGYSATPVAVDASGLLNGKTLVDVATSQSHSCAIDDAGLAYCWGRDGSGSLGNGKAGGGTTPVAVKTDGALAGESLIDIEVGDELSCALADDGDSYCWGSNYHGALGDGSDRKRAVVPVAVDLSAVPGGETLVHLVTNPDETTCALSDGGHAYCWGHSDVGQTGTGLTQNKVSTAQPVVTSGALNGVNLTSLAATWGTFCGLSGESKVYCWGRGRSGSLGNGQYKNSAVPVTVDHGGVLGAARVTQIGSGGEVWLVTEEAP